MTTSHCMHHAIRIARQPVSAWAQMIEALPDGCEQDCGQPKSCRQRIKEYMRMQYRIRARKGK